MVKLRLSYNDHAAARLDYSRDIQALAKLRRSFLSVNTEIIRHMPLTTLNRNFTFDF